MTRLIHYGKKFLRKVRSVKQGSDALAGLGKPCGLWVSVEGEQDWKEWCEAEQFGCLDCATHVILKPDARILWLRGAAALDLFHGEYSFESYRSDAYTRSSIHWPDVADKYQGIIIAPYVWTRRLNGPVSNWYYGWDCASGCIWDAEAVEELRPITTLRRDFAEQLERERLNEQNAPCETCNDDTEECASVPGLRHCEKANR